MANKTLYIVSGADRVGKSTFCQNLRNVTNASLYHFSEPDTSKEVPSLFSRYLDVLSKEDGSTIIFDRSYVCGYILERFRENNHSHIGELVELELCLTNFVDKVVHIGIVAPWSEVALRHKEELEASSSFALWALANKMIARMNEHRFYYQELFEFYDHITIFPHCINPEPQEVPFI